MSIPKLIHKTFPDKSILHLEIKSNFENLQYLNPEWQLRLYEDVDVKKFIIDVYGNAMLRTYNKINPQYGAARADLFRYLLMYHIGGVYLDVKSTITVPLNFIINNDDSYLLSYWPLNDDWGKHACLPKRGEFQQWHIVSAAKHPYLKAVITRVVNNLSFMNGYGGYAVWSITGPICYTQAILPIQQKHQHRMIEADKQGFKYTLFKTRVSHQNMLNIHYSELKTNLRR